VSAVDSQYFASSGAQQPLLWDQQSAGYGAHLGSAQYGPYGVPSGVSNVPQTISSISGPPGLGQGGQNGPLRRLTDASNMRSSGPFDRRQGNGDAGARKPINPNSVIGSVKKLDQLTPAKYEAWFRSVKDALSLVEQSATRKELATLVRLSIADSLRDTLDTAPQQVQDDPDLIADWMRQTALPNRDLESQRLLRRFMTWKQGGYSHADYVLGFERIMTRLKTLNLPVAEAFAGFVLCEGLSNPSQRDMVKSQTNCRSYHAVRAAIMSLSRERTAPERAHDCEEAEEGLISTDEQEEADFTGKFRQKKGKSWVNKNRKLGKGNGDGKQPIKGNQPPTKGAPDRNKGKCFNCGKIGHWKSDCRAPKKKWQPTKQGAFGIMDESDEEVEETNVLLEDEAWEMAMAARPVGPPEGVLYLTMDSACSRNLMGEPDVPPSATWKTLEKPVVYNTPKGRLECHDEVTFKALVKDKKGQKHKIYYKACVAPGRCPPLLSSKHVERLVITQEAAHLTTQGRDCPLVPVGKTGLWALPVYI